MNTATIKEKVRRKKILVGGLNSIGVLLRGKPSEVEDESRKAILEGAVGGSFVLSNGGGMGSHPGRT